MAYGGGYHDQYGGFPTYSQGQQRSAQYYPNGMQYAAQQQPAQPMQQTYPTSMNGENCPKQYYPPQQQTAYSAAQPARYDPWYSGYQQRPPYTAPVREQLYAVCEI